MSNLDLNTSHGGNAVVAQDIISDRVETMELKVHWSSFPNDVLKNRKSAEAEIYFNCKLVASFNSEDHPKGGVVYRDTVLVSTRVGINTLDFVGLGEVDGMGVLFTYVVVRGPREMINSPVAKPNLIQ